MLNEFTHFIIFERNHELLAVHEQVHLVSERARVLDLLISRREDSDHVVQKDHIHQEHMHHDKQRSKSLVLIYFLTVHGQSHVKQSPDRSFKTSIALRQTVLEYSCEEGASNNRVTDEDEHVVDCREDHCVENKHEGSNGFHKEEVHRDSKPVKKDDKNEIVLHKYLESFI